MARLLGSVLALVVVAGCGGTKLVTTTTTPAANFVKIKVYFLHNGKVQPVSRSVTTTEPPWLGAWKDLTAGPTGETAPAATTALPFPTASTARWTLGVTDENVLSLTTVVLSTPALAQTVYTLSQFASARPVVVNGTRYTRSEFEDETPAILVEAPLPEAHVASPLVLTGTANTFEATFEYELVDSAGKVVAKHFATATSGSGTRGTFRLTIAFSGAAAGTGKFVVYESSAKDGSRIHIVEIPVQLTG